MDPSKKTNFSEFSSIVSKNEERKQISTEGASQVYLNRINIKAFSQLKISTKYFLQINKEKKKLKK